MAKQVRGPLRKRAIRIEQDKNLPVYCFSLTGREVLEIADVSRISRDDAGKLIGYQRPEVRRHINDIVEYLDSPRVIFPNSIILSFSSKVVFKKSRGPQVDDPTVSAGTLEIPRTRANSPRPAWIVDGQQRVLALSKSKQPDLRIPVNAFVADHVDLQRDQFLRINNTKPLPRGLITELLPEVTSPLPSNLAASQLPSAICDLLNRDKRSPFYGLIRRASSTEQEMQRAVITDTSIVSMLKESLSNPSGCLFVYRNIATGDIDSEGIWAVLVTFWEAVKRTFPEAWGKKPDKSRLMHGAGIRAMGRLMDRVMSGVDPTGKKAVARVQEELAPLVDVCRWTSGAWEDLGGLRWNDIQNVPPHVRLLSNYLVRAHLRCMSAAG